MTMDRKKIEEIIRRNGYEEFRWISGTEVLVRQFVRFKCMFGCKSYGKNAACPPAVPSIAECRELFNEYENVLIIRVNKKLENLNDKADWSKKTNLDLLKLERAVFLADCHKAFLLFMDECRICETCPGERIECRSPLSARPSAESLGVDVYSTVRSAGFSIHVLTDYEQEMNRFAFLLVD